MSIFTISSPVVYIMISVISNSEDFLFNLTLLCCKMRLRKGIFIYLEGTTVIPGRRLISQIHIKKDYFLVNGIVCRSRDADFMVYQWSASE